MRGLRHVAAFVLALAAMSAQAAELRLANVFGEHMVLQRGQPIRLWGFGTPGRSLRVTFASKSASTVVDRNGRWQVSLPPVAAGGPYVLSVDGERRITFNDVLVGDVWLCGGQSNMAWPLAQTHNAEAAMAAADRPQIRHLRVPNRASLRPEDDIAAAQWVLARPDSVREFSAVGYHFARVMQAELGVPIGLINTAWNGSHLETWVRRDAALQDPDLAAIVRATPATIEAFRAERMAKLETVIARWQSGLPWQGVDTRAWSTDADVDGDWPTLQVPMLWESQGLDGFDGHLWYRRRFELTAEQVAAAAAGPATLHLGQIDDCDESWLNGVKVGGICGWDTRRRYVLPAGLLRVGVNQIAVRVTDLGLGGGFHGDAADVRLDIGTTSLPLAGRWRARVEQPVLNATPTANDLPSLAHNGVLHPLMSLRLRGVLWYQGESNVGRAARYAHSFEQLIRDWRRSTGQPALPFFFVQLAAFRPLRENDVNRSPWAELRDSQRQALALPHTGMAVATDVGDAEDIHPRNKQAVGERLAGVALHQLDRRRPAATGPVMSNVRRHGSSMIVSFRNVAAGLHLGASDTALRGFAIADKSQRFVPAQARIEGERVIAWHPEVMHPVAVRFGWVDNPSQANLFDSNGLPASPFRSDRWALVTRDKRYGR